MSSEAALMGGPLKPFPWGHQHCFENFGGSCIVQRFER